MSFLNSKNSKENIPAYFPYFNHSLFMEQSEFSKEEEIQINNTEFQTSDDSSTSISRESIISLEDEEKLIPLNLLDLSPVKNSLTKDIKDFKPKCLFDSFEKEEKQENEKISPELQKFILPKELFDNSKCKKKNELDDLDEKKLKAKPIIPSKYKMNNTFLVNFPADFFKTPNNLFNKFNNYNQYELAIKKSKKKFVERKGDWRCSKCKNINFAFRNKCNKCKLDKEESEKYLNELNDKIINIEPSTIDNL